MAQYTLNSCDADCSHVNSFQALIIIFMQLPQKDMMQFHYEMIYELYSKVLL